MEFQVFSKRCRWALSAGAAEAIKETQKKRKNKNLSFMMKTGYLFFLDFGCGLMPVPGIRASKAGAYAVTEAT